MAAIAAWALDYGIRRSKPCHSRNTGYPICPSSCTLSHKFNMSSQFSLVKFSSVVLSSLEFEESVAVDHYQVTILTDDIIIF